MSKQSDFSETTEHNMFFGFASPLSINDKLVSNTEKPKGKKRVFEVFHKKEMIYLTPDSVSSNEGEKNPSIQYKCIYCGNKYNNMNRFEAHMRIHTGEKPYKCIFCNKIFTEKGNLKVHIRVHTNDRPYHCPFTNICNQSFKTKSQLSDHILKHTQIKNYSCPECKACFSRKSRLKIHLMIHRGEKPFECKICNKKFREKSNYNYHIKKHFAKTMKSLNKKVENIKDEINIDTNINNFFSFKNKSSHKLSGLSNKSSSTNNDSPNNSDINFSENEMNDNLVNKKGNEISKNTSFNKKNNNFNLFNYPFSNLCINKSNNKLDLFGKDDDLKSIGDSLSKNELNMNTENNQLFDFFPSDDNNMLLKEESKIKEDAGIEKNDNEQNYSDEISIITKNDDNIFINNALEKSNLIGDNNIIDNEIVNKIYNNYFQGDLNLNFETMFLKDNFN